MSGNQAATSVSQTRSGTISDIIHRVKYELSSLTRFLLILSVSFRYASALLLRLLLLCAYLRIMWDISSWCAQHRVQLVPNHLSITRCSLFPFFRCGRAGVGARVLGKTKQGDFPYPSPLLPHPNSTTCRLTTPIDPVLKQDRRGIGKRKLGNSVYSCARARFGLPLTNTVSLPQP